MKITTNPGNRVGLLNTFGYRGIGAELGVFRGEFSRIIKEVCDPNLLCLVDIFRGKVCSGDANGENLAVADMDVMYDDLLLWSRGRRAEVFRAVSYEWLRGLNCCTLDFVYIDTDHTEATTKLELEAARRAVKQYGIIAGHDFHEGNYPGLVKAVREFVQKHDLDCEIWAGDKLPSYRIVNNK